MESNKPIINRRDGNLSLSVFLNTNDGKEYYSIQMQRSYKKKDKDEWVREKVNLFREDLAKLQNLCAFTDADILEYIKNKKQDTELVDDSIPF